MSCGWNGRLCTNQCGAVENEAPREQLVHCLAFRNHINRKEPITMGKHEKKTGEKREDVPAGGKHKPDMFENLKNQRVVMDEPRDPHSVKVSDLGLDPKNPPRLSDLIRELREMGERLGVNLEPHFVKISDAGLSDAGLEALGDDGHESEPENDGSRFHSTLFPGQGPRWGGSDTVTSTKGTYVPHIAHVLGDALRSEEVVEIVANGRSYFGRVLSVAEEICCVELWIQCGEDFHEYLRKGANGTHTFTRPDFPQQAYIDNAAIDAVISMHGEHTGGNAGEERDD